MMWSTRARASRSRLAQSAPASSASTPSTRKHVVRQSGNSPPWQPRTWSFTASDVSELPAHVEVMQVLVEACRLGHGESVAIALQQPSALEPRQQACYPELAHTGETGELLQREVNLHAPLHRASGRLTGGEQLADHPACWVGEQQRLNLSVRLRESLGEFLNHPDRNLRIATNHPFEGFRVNHQHLRCLGDRGLGISGLVGDERFLPEELAGTENGQRPLLVAHRPGDDDTAGLQDVHLLAGLSLAEKDGGLGEFLSEALKEGVLGAHGAGRVRMDESIWADSSGVNEADCKKGVGLLLTSSKGVILLPLRRQHPTLARAARA